MTSSARAGEGFPDGGMEHDQTGGGGGGPGSSGNGDGGSNTGGAAVENHSSSEESQSEDEERRKFVLPISNPVIVSNLSKMPFPETDHYGVKGQFDSGANPRDAPSFPTNFNSVGKLAGQTDSIVGSYNAVAALRKVDRSNPSFSGGGQTKN